MKETVNLVEEDFNKALDILRSLGAEIVDPADFRNAEELKASDLGEYEESGSHSRIESRGQQVHLGAS
jgi:amidase